MTELRIVQVEAFADLHFTGNPAAVMPLEEWLPDEMLQAIAMENNLSETAFTIPVDGDADFELRWFTPTTEVVLCGHATLASGHVLIQGERVRFRTRRAGPLEVARDGDALCLVAAFLEAEPKPLPRIVEALGCTPVDALWHPHRYGLVVLGTEAEVLALRPDFPDAEEEGDILTIVTAPGSDADIVSRVFATGQASTRIRSPARPTPCWCLIGRSGSAAITSRRGRRAVAAAALPAAWKAIASSSAVVA